MSSMLEKNYGVPAGENLADQLETVASQLAREYWEDNRRDILGILEDSFLEEYDEFNVGVAFRNAAEVSISYSLMLRCGLESENYFEHEDFMSVFDFNTPETAGALGTAVSGINQQVLREIGATIRNYEREQIAERSTEHGNDVQAEIAQREAAEWEYVEQSKYEAQTEENDAADMQAGIASPEKTEPAEMESVPHFQDDNDLIGAELTLDGRRFAVDEVRDGRASLRDITFQNGTGFPIFRNEPVETVRGILFPEKTTVPQVNLEAELTEAELALMRPQLDAAGIDYLVANAGYNRRTISFSSQHYREVQDMLDALPEELEQPRFTVELTSDAFEEPFIIRDNSVPEGRDGQYYDVGGIYQTFSSEQEAHKYADRLNGKETFEQPQMTSETEAIYPSEQTGLPYDIVTERLRTEPEHTPPEPEASAEDVINFPLCDGSNL